jgi:membrane-associated protease RseP (regulator of RpoE activity)
MFSIRTTTCAFGLLLGGAVVMLALPLLNAQQAPAVHAQALAPDAPQAPDLQKQVEDALKELDKLEKAVPNQPEQLKQQIDDVRQQMRRQLLPGIGNPLVIGPGFVQDLGNPGGLGRNFGRLAGPGQGRWGVALNQPAPVLIDQLRLPAGQGLVVIDVVPDSAAAKAGILKHDILLEVDGKPVSSDLQTFQRDARDIKADTDVTVSVLRRGAKETIKGLRLPEARNDAVVQPFAGFQALQPFIPPGLGGGVQLQVIGNGGNESTSVQMINDDFTITHTSGGLKATLKGKRENGKVMPAEITIQDGDMKVAVQSIDQVPERYRATITRMLAAIR